ncbi:TatD family nuclease-associated radical SAM protein [Shewanella olleyana]|uniref:TatD family nuclease-associated radical SAM protein n=1 Tax=Shewanella olleyana TaxID=135626 RepID=UPI00200BC90B|nr:TatD family nuclease-associated radical SAM protein [Shewanella olleyana]MCL1068750.1 TatD family nuclease-associated radical SAM protein [Shewanella olleyana]
MTNDLHSTTIIGATEATLSEEHQDSTLVYDIRQSRYLNITGRCTLRCQFCPKHNGSKQVHQYELSLEKQVKPNDIIPLLGDVKDFDEYVFCGYGEPTLNLNTLIAVATLIKAKGGKTRLNTDGLGNLFHRRNILPELASCIDSLSISLNADTEAAYIEHCKPKLKGAYDALLDFIELAPKYIPQVQVSAINGLEQVNIEQCREIVEQRGCEFKQRELDIVG